MNNREIAAVTLLLGSLWPARVHAVTVSSGIIRGEVTTGIAAVRETYRFVHSSPSLSLAGRDVRDTSSIGRGVRASIGTTIATESHWFVPQLTASWSKTEATSFVTSGTFDSYRFVLDRHLFTVGAAVESHLVRRYLHLLVGTGYLGCHTRWAAPSIAALTTEFRRSAILFQAALGLRLPTAPLSAGFSVFTDVGWPVESVQFDGVFVAYSGVAWFVDLDIPFRSFRK